MVRTASTMMPLGTKAPDFLLPDASGRQVGLKDFQNAPALLIVFLCNHCPYVKHLADSLATVLRAYQERGVAVVGINSNDFDAYPDDSPQQMEREVQQRGYTFPYLVDATQQVAQAYRAACTPDFFLFDGQQQLAYRGQFDSSRPGSEIPVTGEDLCAAMDAVLAGQAPRAAQKPSLGCNIKWRPGNEPDYFQGAG